MRVNKRLDEIEFRKIIENVSERERRFGNISPQLGLTDSLLQAENNKSTLFKGVNI